jgi:hypothetical protein
MGDDRKNEKDEGGQIKENGMVKRNKEVQRQGMESI